MSQPENPSRRQFLRQAGSLALGAAAAAPLAGCLGRARSAPGAAVSANAAPSGAATIPRQPNVIFIFADQLRAGALSCYDPAQPATPNFDKLAAEGVRFTNAISTWPVCSPYRAMLLTGRYPMSNGVAGNEMALRDGQATIAKALRAQGYATGYIGKWHLEDNFDPFVPLARRQGFDTWAVRNCAHEYFDSFYCANTPAHIALPGYEPDAQTGLALDFIRRNKERPFCLFLSWGPPHDPYVAPEEALRQIAPESIKLRPNVAEGEAVRALLAADPGPVPPEMAARRAEARGWLADDDQIRRRLRAYHAATRALDANMGRIMAALAEAGVADDTILVFSSDHGDMLGSHRMASKQMPYEESINIPFLLRYPRATPAGQVSDALLAPVDVMPTLLDLAGAPVPPGVEGISQAGAARGGSGDKDQEAVLLMKMVPGGNPWIANGVREWRGVRTKTHTYARSLYDGPWLLFDNEHDPYQLHNLINDPAQRRLQRRMDETMRRLMDRAHDPFDTETILARLSRGTEETNRKPAGAGTF